MATVNAYRFVIALGAYCVVGWALGRGLFAAATAGWSHAVVTSLAFAFVLVCGALAFLALKGSALVRLVLVALLAPLSHIGLLAVFGDPFHIGLAIQEVALLLLGAGVVLFWQWVALRIAGGHKNEA